MRALDRGRETLEITPWSDLRRTELSAGPVEYHDTGQGPPVVLLHGVVMNHTQWDRILPLLPAGLRYIRPVLPLGGHRLPMRNGADLSLGGLTSLLAEFLDALALEGVTLVHSDWGGGLFLTARGLDARVARLVVFPCEAWDNFPPGLPGRIAALAGRLPGGLVLAAAQLRSRRLRRSPLLLGQMAKKPLPDEVVESWTEGLHRDPAVRRDLRRYLTSPLEKERLRQDTQALAHFAGPVLVAWCPENRVMPSQHGADLAALVPNGRHVDIEDAFALPMLDNPVRTAEVLSAFLTDELLSNDS